MKPRKKPLRIERTAYSDATLAAGIKDEWIITAPGLSVHRGTIDEVLLIVRAHLELELEAELDAHSTTT